MISLHSLSLLIVSTHWHCLFRAAIYTPKVEDHSRLSESWHLRHAQRAVSIDNISFISCAMDEKHSVSSNSKNAFSTLNGGSSTNGHPHHHSSNGNYAGGTTTNGNGTINDDSATAAIVRNGNGSNDTTYSHSSNNKHASTDNLHRNSDDEQDNIIPWRAQLRKTNSRLSLVG